MKLACPYCGAAIGDGWPTHLTPLRIPQVASAAGFRTIDLDQVWGLKPRPSEHRVIQSCPDEGCKAAAMQVQPPGVTS